MKTIKGYKAYDKGLKCKDFQYEVGKEYEHKDPLKICESGFHFCENPLDVLNYYNIIESEFSEVEAIGKIVKNKDEDTKMATDKIKIGVKLDLPMFIKASFDFLWKVCGKKDKNQLAASGHYAQLAASGHSAQLTASGHSAQLTASGDYAQLAASGDYAKLAASGDSAKLAASGHYAQLAASGDYAKLAASGHYAQLTASGDSAKLAVSGHYAQLAASGHYAQLAASGDYAKLELNGNKNVGANIGIDGKIKGKIGCWITLAEYKYVNGKHEPIIVLSAKIDGKKLKEDTWYIVRNSKFVEYK